MMLCRRAKRVPTPFFILGRSFFRVSVTREQKAKNMMMLIFLQFLEMSDDVKCLAAKQILTKQNVIL